MRQTGTANLPLHTGRAPRWLFERMVRLSGAIAEAVVLEHGTGEFLRRVSDPVWFQALSCVIGFDWHSSGTTTTTCGALKVALGKRDVGVGVAGGKGRTSRKTPGEIKHLGDDYGLPVDELVRASRLSAKVDTGLVQDGYDLYHHCFFLSRDGGWAVVQQGLNPENKYARRYHWLSEGVESYVEEPHRGICSDARGPALDMTARESGEARSVSLDLVCDGPGRLRRLVDGQASLQDFTGPTVSLPRRHEVLDVDIGPRSMEALRRAYEVQPESYEELVGLRGVGPETIRALSLVADLVYGASPSRLDPAAYSFAHGGKDGYPYPVDRRVYDESISVLEDALEAADVEHDERMKALRRLSELV